MDTTTPTRTEVPTMPDPAGSPIDPTARNIEPTAPPAAPVSEAATTVEDRIRTFLSGEQRRVVATVSLWCASPDDALDAVTDATGRAWERLARGESIDNLAAWVTRVAMNRVRSGHRRRDTARRKGHLVAVVADATDDPIAATAAHLDLRRALAHLTDRQRVVVALHHGLDRSIDEIAAELGVAPGTVKSTLHQARARLATILDHPDTGGSR